jgi:hypothetical protein
MSSAVSTSVPRGGQLAQCVKVLRDPRPVAGLQGNPRGPEHVGDRGGDQHIAVERGHERHEVVEHLAGLIEGRLVQDERDEGADEAEAMLVEERADLRGVRRQVADRPHLRGLEAERCHLGEHALGGQHAAPARDLADAPRDRCARQLAAVVVGTRSRGAAVHLWMG